MNMTELDENAKRRAELKKRSGSVAQSKYNRELESRVTAAKIAHAKRNVDVLKGSTERERDEDILDGLVNDMSAKLGVVKHEEAKVEAPVSVEANRREETKKAVPPQAPRFGKVSVREVKPDAAK